MISAFPLVYYYTEAAGGAEVDGPGADQLYSSIINLILAVGNCASGFLFGTVTT